MRGAAELDLLFEVVELAVARIDGALANVFISCHLIHLQGMPAGHVLLVDLSVQDVTKVKSCQSLLDLVLLR